MGGSPECLARRKKQKGKTKKNKDKEEQKYSLEEIARNEDLISKILSKTQARQREADLAPTEQLGNLTKEHFLPRDRRTLPSAKRHPLNREEKHLREVQALLLMDGILSQTARYTPKQKIVDFAKVRPLLPPPLDL